MSRDFQYRSDFVTQIWLAFNYLPSRFYSMLHVPFRSLAPPYCRYLIRIHLAFSTSLAPATFPRHRVSPSFPLHSFLPFNIVFSRIGFTEWRKGCLTPGHFIRLRVFTGTMKFIVYLSGTTPARIQHVLIIHLFSFVQCAFSFPTLDSRR